MKVLFCNRNPDSWVGGDQKQLEHTATELQKLGVEVAYNYKHIVPHETFDGVDIVHCYNFSMPWTKYQIWDAKKHGKKVVCSMIYHETDSQVDYETQQAMIDEVDACVFLTPGELEKVKRHLTVDKRKVFFIENGLESWWFDAVERPIVSDVLTVGRIDAHKGQLAVANVCKKLGLQYTCIGQGEAYADLVAQTGATVLDAMPQAELKNYYAGCRVFALVSFSEIMPLTIMEAGSQGRPMVISDKVPWDIDKFVWRAEYNNEEQIEAGLKNALAQNSNKAFRTYLQGFTWEKAAKQYLQLYESILGR